MKVTQRCVRVYGSSAYGANEGEDLSPLSQPITIEPYDLGNGKGSGRVLLHLGAPVDWVIEASRIRRAIGLRILQGLFQGRPIGQNPDVEIEEALQDIDPSEPWQDEWYVTIVIDQDIEVPESTLTGRKYAWFVDDNFNRADEFERLTSPHIDQLVSIASTVIDPSAFEKIILDDQVFFAAEGRTLFGLPNSKLSARATVKHPISQLDFGKLEMRLRASAELPSTTFAWLGEVEYWWLAGLQEQDAWRAFMLLYIALELLHNSLAKQYYPHVVTSTRITSADLTTLTETPVMEALLAPIDRSGGVSYRIASPGKLSDSGKFAVLALALFPEAADSDFAIFLNIKRLRNQVTHGHRQVTDISFPLSELRNLLERYLDAAIGEHITSSLDQPDIEERW